MRGEPTLASKPTSGSSPPGRVRGGGGGSWGGGARPKAPLWPGPRLDTASDGSCAPGSVDSASASAAACCWEAAPSAGIGKVAGRPPSEGAGEGGPKGGSRPRRPGRWSEMGATSGAECCPCPRAWERGGVGGGR
ncbi:hypothetical protein MNEG_14100 [Monoraphidium neglectum]|uniref:Uncharacterized protein n=1 Tax=Monoraphidium neglectum TaxID=145388 RepID=A0A0D2LQ42_9CHLO|nr:hypothetical protein MNEG_14100 [Monoraphidium neglectum]KIY93864.1 hypothetical protein MNEG_14100 [Monoraphidium neglectum]|eukprot:XP_013892884.1 hypothetical protein MNEG_14100 [Monoraphidium neglectum]